MREKTRLPSTDKEITLEVLTQKYLRAISIEHAFAECPEMGASTYFKRRYEELPFQFPVTLDLSKLRVATPDGAEVEVRKGDTFDGEVLSEE